MEWTGKVDEIAFLCKTEFVKQQIIVWCNFVDEVELVSQILRKHKINSKWIHGGLKHRSYCEKLFKAGGFKVLVAQVDCYTYGADFSNVDVMFYHSCPLSNVVRTQTQHRACHIKKKRQVLIIDCKTKNTVDEDIFNSYKLKHQQSKKIKYLVQKMGERSEN